MKKRILSINIVLMILLSHNIYSQKTPYEKRVYQVTIDFFKDMGISESELKKQQASGTDINMFFKEVNVVKKITGTLDGEIRFLKWKQDMEDAKKLRNATEIKKEADLLAEEKRKEEEEKRLQQEKAEKEKLERKRKEDVAEKLEQEKIEKEKQEMLYKKSDYVAIKKEIKENFEKWYIKSDFEKTEDYNERIKSKESKFDSICYQTITNIIERRESYRRVIDSKLEYLPYNADNEFFPVKISLSDFSFIDTLRINIQDAQKIKRDYDNFQIAQQIHRNYEDNNFQIQMPKKYTNWCLRNNYLFPLKVGINEGAKLKIINVPLKDAYNLFNFSSKELDLSIEMEELKFNFLEYENKIIEAEQKAK